MPVPYCAGGLCGCIWCTIVGGQWLILYFWEDCQKVHKKFKQLGDQHQRSGPRSLFGGYERVTLLRLILDRPGIYLYEQLLEMWGHVSEVTICSQWGAPDR
jgi:hypothetical protein